ncbi:MAG: septum formation initiator family protein [Anaerolineales bacterium]|nr:septum formation initiator family protein [Anaerolineales bacterium]
MKHLPIDWRRVAVIAGVLFLVVIIVDFNSRLEKLDRLNRQAVITRAEATQVSLTRVALETQVSNASSDQIVEEQARSEGHMIQEGDHPVSILGDEGEPVLTNIEPTPIPTPKPNWQLWWDLFFGEE